ncbi:MAG: NUDIX hydrolase [Thermoproteota archaeon]
MAREDVLEVEEAYRGKLISLLKYHVSVNGRRTVREVVEHPGAVAIIPVKEDGKIILIRQHRLPAGRSLIEIPAGTKRNNEEDEECARRELLEETGYRASILRKIRSVYLAPGYSTEKITLFLASGLEKAEQSLDEDENIDVLEAVPREVFKMLREGAIEDAKTIIGIYELMRRLGEEGLSID